MRKNKLLLLLALLLTAATGARAAWTGGTYTATANENLGAITVNGDATLTINSDVTVTITGGINVASGTLTVTGPGTLVVNGAKGNNGNSGWEGSNGSNGGVAISGNIIVQGGATVTATGGTGGNGGTGTFVAGTGGNGGVAFAGKLTYKSGTVTANGGSAGSGGYIDDEERYASSGSAGKAFANDVDFTQTTGYSVTNGTSTIGSVLNQTKVVISGGTEPAAAAGYTVSLKDGVKDADKWTISPNPAEEGQTVTLQYTGRLKVKGVKATSDAAPAEAPTITLDNTTTAWTAGKYAVPAGGLTYSAAITVSGDVTLVLTDGETLTLNKGISLASGATLTVEGNGTMNVNGTDGNTSSTVAGSTGTLTLTSGTLTATGGNGGSGVYDSYGGNGGDAINGSVIVSGGTLTATGGNGGSSPYGDYNCHGGNGGDAINGSVTVSSGTLTARGGNGGSVDDFATLSSGGKGGDAISGTLTINGGSTSVNDGSNGSIGNMCDNCTAGTGGKATAEPAAKEPATVTTAPTGAAIVGVGKTTELVSGGVADGGTLMYAVTTTNTKPASTDGFSATVPTAQSVTASGKVYVWYFVKGDDTHSDSEIAATAIEVPVADVVWDATNLSDLYVSGTYASSTIEGITLSGNADQMSAMWNGYGDPTHDGIAFNMNESGGYTFTAPNGKAFTKIVMKPQGQGGWDMANLGTGWTFNADYNEDIEEYIFTVTWKGNAAASTVVLLKDADMFAGETISYIVFYLSDAE